MSELFYISAARLAGMLRRREVSATEVVESCIERQIAVNDKLNAVVMNCFARARAEARTLDQRAAKKDFAGPLHGVPMTIKDSFDTEGVISTGGTFGRQQYVPQADATVVARVRKAGAILLGKTNTPEFTLGGLGLPTTSNLLFGSSHNPYDLARSTFASSGGAAAVVAAGLAAFDIGTDYSGSIRLPAHNNGVAGLRPTAVRVPRTGHIVDYGGVCDLWQQVGPLCRRVEDIELIMPIISGPDFRDAACAPVPWRDPGLVRIAGLRVAFVTDNGARGDEAADEDTKRTVRQVAKWLEEAGSRVTEGAPTQTLVELSQANEELNSADGYAMWQRLAKKWGTNNISPLRRRWIESSPPRSSAELVEIWERHDAAKSRLLQWMTGYDVFICPAYGKPAQLIDGPLVDSGGEQGQGDPVWQYTESLSSAGWPVAVVRAGSSADGRLPIGLQLAAAPWREDVALAVARYVESRSGGWREPPL
jgi:amidase